MAITKHFLLYKILHFLKPYNLKKVGDAGRAAFVVIFICVSTGTKFVERVSVRR